MYSYRDGYFLVGFRQVFSSGVELYFFFVLFVIIIIVILGLNLWYGLVYILFCYDRVFRVFSQYLEFGLFERLQDFYFGMVQELILVVSVLILFYYFKIEEFSFFLNLLSYYFWGWGLGNRMNISQIVGDRFLSFFK